MRNDRQTLVSRFLNNQRGGFTIMLAFAAPVILVGIAIAVDFSNSVTMRQRTQAAADAAALAATTSMANSIAAGSAITATQAQTIATEFFNANAPAQAISGETNFGAKTSVTGSSVSTVVTYNGATGTLVSGFAGAPLTVSITATATSAITTTYTSPTGSFAGNGWIAEDPIVTGANGSSFEYQCDVSHATWYNLVSDQNFEVNANCDGTPYWSELYKFNVMAGTHTISVAPSFVAVAWPGYGNINREVWSGDVTIDGQFYPATAGTNTYLNDTSSNISVKVVVGQAGVAGSAANYVLVTTPEYTVSIAYDSDDDGSYNLGFADIQIAATNAGACSSPGGVWGKTLSGVNDSTASDFAVATPTTTVAQFSATCGVASSSISTAKITQ